MIAIGCVEQDDLQWAFLFGTIFGSLVGSAISYTAKYVWLRWRRSRIGGEEFSKELCALRDYAKLAHPNVRISVFVEPKRRDEE